MPPDAGQFQSTAPQGRLVVRPVTDPGEFRGLEAAHHLLFAACDRPHIGNSFPLVIADAATGPAGQPWQAFTAWRNGALTGCLVGRPVRRKVVGLPVTAFEVGSRFVADPLVAPGSGLDTLRALVDALVETRRDCAVVSFARLSEAAFEQVARVANDLQLPWQWRWAGYAYGFDTTIGIDEFLRRLDGDRRRELGRRLRRLGREHGSEFVREERLSEQADLDRFDSFARLEDSGWKGQGGTSILRRPGHADYYRELVRSASRAGMLGWYTLRAGERPVAMFMTLRTGAVRWLPKMGYDEDFAVHAPGMLLNHHVLTEAVEDPAIRWADNISGAPWVATWNPVIVPFRSITLFGRGLRPALLARARVGLDLARRLAGRSVAVGSPTARAFL